MASRALSRKDPANKPALDKYAIDRGSSVCVFLNKKKTDRLNRIRIESARVRGSNKDGRDVFLAVS